MKCVVSDYLNGEIKIINIDNSQTDEIEEILTERFEYSLENIEWILVNCPSKGLRAHRYKQVARCLGNN
jgi:hypothetical protein